MGRQEQVAAAQRWRQGIDLDGQDFSLESQLYVRRAERSKSLSSAAYACAQTTPLRHVPVPPSVEGWAIDSRVSLSS